MIKSITNLEQNLIGITQIWFYKDIYVDKKFIFHTLFIQYLNLWKNYYKIFIDSKEMWIYSTQKEVIYFLKKMDILNLEEFEKIINSTKPFPISIKNLLCKVNPYNQIIWTNIKLPITKNEIWNFINDNKILSPIEYKNFIKEKREKDKFAIFDNSSREMHIKRIAWLIMNYKEEYPISINITEKNKIEILDWNHRFAAAIYLNKEYINAKINWNKDNNIRILRSLYHLQDST